MKCSGWLKCSPIAEALGTSVDWLSNFGYDSGKLLVPIRNMVRAIGRHCSTHKVEIRIWFLCVPPSMTEWFLCKVIFFYLQQNKDIGELNQV
eukprot:snap_masked-scaffold_10-processed-gene-9.31-mRNA-1 protein AED:1.00 eAED:1.00 QI:0/-1/0/0/-1/1/1/0/91